jgi:hypothetical protein
MAKGDKAAEAVKNEEAKEEAVKKDDVAVEPPKEEEKDEAEEVAQEEVKKEEIKEDEEKETTKMDETTEVKKDEDAAAMKDESVEVKKEDEKEADDCMKVDGGGSGEKKEEAPAENKKKRGRKPKSESPAKTKGPAKTPDPNKRLRRSSQTVTYQPEDFKSVTHTVQIFRGRGTKLKDLEAVRTSIDRFTRTSEEMHNAHRFLFTMRGKVPQAQVKGNILEFNGFLKYFDKDKVEKEAMDKEDEEAEVGLLSLGSG